MTVPDEDAARARREASIAEAWREMERANGIPATIRPATAPAMQASMELSMLSDTRCATPAFE